MNNPLKPLSDMTKSITSLMQGAGGLMEKTGGEGFGQGFKGVVQDLLDLNVDCLIETMDARLGAGVMRLVMVGDTKGMETVVQFRNYVMMRLVEMKDVRDVANKFMSEDPELSATGLAEMSEFLEGRQPEVVCSDREETLRLEIKKLRKIVKQMGSFLDGEALMLGEDDESDVDEEAEEAEKVDEVREVKEAAVRMIPNQSTSIIIRGARTSSSS